jgi:hypothetical protein
MCFLDLIIYHRSFHWLGEDLLYYITADGALNPHQNHTRPGAGPGGLAVLPLSNMVVHPIKKRDSPRYWSISRTMGFVSTLHKRSVKLRCFVGWKCNTVARRGRPLSIWVRSQQLVLP